MLRVLLFTLVLSALTSCQSSMYFNTPNDVRNINGTVYLMNGKTVDGRIVVNTRTFFSGKVKVYEGDNPRPMQFPVADVKGYTIRGSYYALKEIRTSNPLHFGKKQTFLKRISGPSSLIHLYEGTEESTTTNTDGSTRKQYETQFYLELPGENTDDVWPLNGSKFVPNFDEKMSRLVKDCPSLAQKIAAKEPGYFYAQVTVFKERRAEVLLNIIDEYNRCKSTGAIQ